jgi:anti-sigma factor RsiW
MKCDDCLNLLEAYVDGEAGEHDADLVQTHLMTCASCAGEFEALTAESELYARYDRELQISPAIWNGIAAQIATEPVVDARKRRDARGWLAGLFAVPRFGLAFSGAMAVLIAAVAVGYLYFRTQPTQQSYQASSGRLQPANSISNTSNQTTLIADAPKPAPERKEAAEPQNVDRVPQPVIAQNRRAPHPGPLVDDPGVVVTDAAYTDLDERDTASHLEQAQKLLVSFRTLQTDDDQDVDVSYEKTESRRLLNENVVLRRDAELTGKFPTKSVLGSLEPFLIDIANLPDKASARDVQQIKDRVQRTEIVAELRSY